MRKIRIYVAGPLTSSGEPEVNVKNAINYADEIMKAGGYPFVPHLSLYWHRMNGAEHTYDTWMDYDYAWIDVCDAMMVVPGQSHGVDLEIAYCEEHGILIFLDLTTCLAWIRQGGSKSVMRRLNVQLGGEDAE